MVYLVCVVTGVLDVVCALTGVVCVLTGVLDVVMGVIKGMDVDVLVFCVDVIEGMDVDVVVAACVGVVTGVLGVVCVVTVLLDVV